MTSYANKLFMITESASTKASSRIRGVPEQVALDLANYLDNFPNKNFGMRFLAKESGINERTIKRLLERKNHPSFPTLFRLYTTITGKLDVEQVIEACPEIIKEEIKKKCPNKEEGRKYCKTNFYELIKNDPLLGELYVLAGTGPLYKDSITFKYGQYGLERLEELESLNILIKKDKNTFVLGPNSPTIDGPIIKALGLRFVQRFCKPSNAQIRGNNVMNFYAEGLNREGINEWTRIDEEAFYKKIEVASNPKYKGSVPMFSFSAVDSVELENKND